MAYWRADTPFIFDNWCHCLDQTTRKPGNTGGEPKEQCLLTLDEASPQNAVAKSQLGQEEVLIPSDVLLIDPHHVKPFTIQLLQETKTQGNAKHKVLSASANY